MNNSAYTVDLLNKWPITQIQGTGFQSESRERQHRKVIHLFSMAKVAGLALSLAVSPVTAMTDPWLLDRRRRDAVVTMAIYQEVLGRFISRSEALRIARQILEQAEQERLDIVQLEATRGVQWGDRT